MQDTNFNGVGDLGSRADHRAYPYRQVQQIFFGNCLRFMISPRSVSNDGLSQLRVVIATIRRHGSAGCRGGLSQRTCHGLGLGYLSLHFIMLNENGQAHLKIVTHHISARISMQALE